MPDLAEIQSGSDYCLSDAGISMGAMREMVVDGVLSAEEDWERHRRPISASLNKIDEYYPTIQSKAEGILDKIARCAESGLANFHFNLRRAAT